MDLTLRRSWVLPSLAASAALVTVAAGAAAAVETDTVTSFGRGLWWSLSLMTTVGFLGDPPRTVAGAALSVLLMLSGFFLLALVSAGLASLFVREDERAVEQVELQDADLLIAEVARLHARLDGIQALLGQGQRGRAGEAAAPAVSDQAVTTTGEEPGTA